MKVKIELSEDITEPYAVILTNDINERIEDIVNFIKYDSNSKIIAKDNERIVILNPNDIFMVKVENKQVIIYTENNSFKSKKRLYKIENQLNNDFIRISKSTIINLNKIDNIVPSLGGIMYVNLINKCSDSISRKYLHNFKKRLGL